MLRVQGERDSFLEAWAKAMEDFFSKKEVGSMIGGQKEMFVWSSWYSFVLNRTAPLMLGAE